MNSIFNLLTEDQKTGIYLDWVNNFLTIERFAEYYGLDVDAADYFINTMRKEWSEA